MFSAIYFFNLRGDILIQRIYRDDIECAPVSLLGGISTAAVPAKYSRIVACH